MAERRTRLPPDLLQLVDAALSDKQTAGATLGAMIDKDWLLEDGKEAPWFLYYFPEDFLGWEELNIRMIEYLESDDWPEVMMWLPGGHGKSTTLLRWATRVMCREPEISFIFIEKTEPKSHERAQYLMKVLEHNPRLKAHFGDFKGDPWSARGFTIKQRKAVAQQPSMAFYGAGGHGGLGSRCNILLVDDPVTQENSGSELERDTMWRWWTQAASTCPYPLPISTTRYLKRTVLSGTTFHLDDLYHRVLKNGGFKLLHLKAVNDDGSVLAPLRFCYEDKKELAERATVDPDAADLQERIRKGYVTNLYEYRRNRGVSAFMRRYQNVVSDPDMQLFPEVWFAGGDDEMAPPGGYPGCWDDKRALGEERKNGWVYVTGIDPAAGMRTQASVRFASVTLGFDPENPAFTHLVGLEYGHHPLDSDVPGKRTQVNAVLDQVRHFKSKVVLETNNIQGVYDGVLRKAARKMGIVLSITGHTTTRQKKQDTELGIEAMAPMVENGYLRLPGKSRKTVQELVNEMILYGVNPTDDILMAFWFAWRVIERMRTRTVVQKADPMRLKAYMQSKEQYDFPPEWTDEQKQRYFGLIPDEEDLEEAV